MVFDRRLDGRTLDFGTTGNLRNSDLVIRIPGPTTSTPRRSSRAGTSGDDRLPPKERVVFCELDGAAFAVPFSTLQARRVVRLDRGGRSVAVRWRGGVASSLDAEGVAGGRDVGSAEVLEDGRLVPFDQPFWFAVAAFRPDVEIVR